VILTRWKNLKIIIPSFILNKRKSKPSKKLYDFIESEENLMQMEELNVDIGETRKISNMNDSNWKRNKKLRLEGI
jgi:hypothetical protein